MGPWVWTKVLPTSLEVDLVLSEGLDPILDLILDPPVKLQKEEEDHIPNHLLGLQSGVLTLDLAQDQDLPLIQEADLDRHPTADHLHYMIFMYLFGKSKFLDFRITKEISWEM